jgi:uncharacterized damage-inducible protein DinB
MSVAEFRMLFAYDEWANARLLEAVAALSDEQTSRKLESSFPSLLETVSHIAFAEWVWLRRWCGDSPTARPAWAADATLARLAELLREVATQRAAYLAALLETRLDAPLAYRNLKGEEHRHLLADLFRHVVNHSTYHRGQAATLLRQLGAKAPATDYVVFRGEAR